MKIGLLKKPDTITLQPVSAAVRYQAFDLLATLVVVVHLDGVVVFANAALEDALSISRRM